jgi:pyrimidine operon attenuation protein/uracil phosphoribosyltransferase
MTLPQPSTLIDNMVADINQRFPILDDNIVMVGIHTGGAWIANQLFSKLNLSTELGLLDISFYRDDFSQSGLHPKVKSSELPDIEGKTIILVDDVIMSGRTIRAAMNELFDYGRPEKIILACLLDVGHRELPIQADIIGQVINRPADQRIKLSGPEPLTLSTVILNK